MSGGLEQRLPADWRSALAGHLRPECLVRLERFLESERRGQEVYPPPEQVFAALQLTPWQRVKVVIFGQDPYHDAGQACGLAFAVPDGCPLPPSLRNIFREYADDLGFPLPAGGDLRPWARQGVLLLNTVLTVRAHEPASHQGRGWEEVTDAMVKALAARRSPVVFVFWGKHAAGKEALLSGSGHPVIRSPHPSPLSAYRGFFGSRPFSRCNEWLQASGQSPIDWRLPVLPAVQPELPGLV